MPSSIEIIGFLIILYTVYLILTEGSKNKEASSEENNDAEIESSKKERKETKKKGSAEKERRSVDVQTIEGDADVLRQGKGYDEQEAVNMTAPIPPQRAEYTEQRPMEQSHEQSVSSEEERVKMRASTNAPSSKYQNTEQQISQQPQQEMVSVVCPYCDNKVLVPKGGNAECSCCSSILNDTGGIMDTQ